MGSLCPVIDKHEDLPDREFVYTPPTNTLSALGSTSSGGDDLSWLNNSNDVANDIVRRHWEDQRRAFYTMTRNSTPTSSTVLEFASR